MLKILETDSENNPTLVEYYGQKIKEGDVINFKASRSERKPPKYFLVDSIIEKIRNGDCIAVTLLQCRPTVTVRLDQNDPDDEFSFRILTQAVGILNDFGESVLKIIKDLRRAIE